MYVIHRSAVPIFQAPSRPILGGKGTATCLQAMRVCEAELKSIEKEKKS
jgi:hypothetical protein